MSEQTRKLSAIMLTDMVGYSALSNSNEKKAIEPIGRAPLNP